MATPFVELERQIQHLAEENALLRARYARERRGEYRRSGIALMIFGAVMLVLGLVGYTGTTLSSLFLLSGIGTVFVGILTVFLTPERLVRSEVMHRGLISSARALDGILRDLGLRSSAIYLPSKYRGKPVLVLPVSEKHFDIEDWLKRPSESVLVVGKSAEGCGIAIEPLGLSLLTLVRDELHVSLEDTESLPSVIQEVYSQGLELCDAVDVELVGNTIRMRFVSPLFLEFCTEVVRDAPMLCTNVGCPYCSLALLMVCESTGSLIKKRGCSVLREERVIEVEAELVQPLRMST